MSCQDLFHLRFSSPSRNLYTCSEENPTRLHTYVLQDSVCNENCLQVILMETNLHRHSVKPELNNKQCLQKAIRFPAGKKKGGGKYN